MEARNRWHNGTSNIFFITGVGVRYSFYGLISRIAPPNPPIVKISDFALGRLCDEKLSRNREYFEPETYGRTYLNT